MAVPSEVIPKAAIVGSSGRDLQMYVIDTWNHEQTNEGKNACSGDLGRASNRKGRAQADIRTEHSKARLFWALSLTTWSLSLGI